MFGFSRLHIVSDILGYRCDERREGNLSAFNIKCFSLIAALMYHAFDAFQLYVILNDDTGCIYTTLDPKVQFSDLSANNIYTCVLAITTSS